MRRLAILAAALGALVPGAPGASGQDGPFADETARALYETATRARARLQTALVSYTAVVRQRTGVSLRMPLKDRTLYRSESAHRVHWERDGDVLVQVLALREQGPTGEDEGEVHLGVFDDNFDPANDQLMFGMVPPDDEMYDEGRDDFWIAHPLSPEHLDGYRFSVGDTLVLSLPDGSAVHAVELRVVPAVADVHRVVGSLWIEPRSGSLVRAAYRLSDAFDAFRDLPDLREEEERGDLDIIPGMFKPWTAEIEVISVEYALWSGGVWLPRAMHADGVARAGVLRVPAATELTYTFESVRTEEDLAMQPPDAADPVARLLTADGDGPAYRLSSRSARRGPRAREKVVRYLVPEDPAYLAQSPDLPPPIHRAAPGFTSEAELRELVGGLADLPEPPRAATPRTFRWGLQRPDLVRYNRVEALSLGARAQVRPDTRIGPLSVTATARLGVADAAPNVRLDVTRETLLRRFTWSAYRELAAMEEDARHLGIGNSVTALLFGRDDGDYYRRSGTAIEWTPPAAARRSFRVRAYAEYHEAAGAKTDFALGHVADSAWSFRPNPPADEGWELGGDVTIAPWWGSDPRSAQGGLDLTLGAAGGDRSFTKAALTARAVLPLARVARLGLEAGAGTTWGDPPLQRLWAMGGATTLRGYEPRSLVGPTFGRARAELSRTVRFGAVSLFADGAWAGERGRMGLDDALGSAGVGLSLVDGLIRVDAAWGLREPRDFRLELYLDGIL